MHNGVWDGVAGESLCRPGFLNDIIRNMTFARKILFSFGLNFLNIVLTDIKYRCFANCVATLLVVNSNLIFWNNQLFQNNVCNEETCLYHREYVAHFHVKRF